MELRKYQRDALIAVYEKWKEYRKVLVSMPTGSGKTIVFANIAAGEEGMGGSALILCHRDELIRQAQDKLKKATGLECDIEKAEQFADDDSGIVVGSVQTLMRQNRLERFKPDRFSKIIVDEAHHCLSDSWQRVLNHFSAAHVVGFTATGERGDKKNLGKYFEELAYEYSLRQAITDGWLCRIVAKTHPLKIDLTGVRVMAGDYNEGDLGNALDPYLPRIAEAIPPDRKTLIFTPLCITAQRLQGILRDSGRRAYYASGEDRSQMPAWEQDGAGAVMLNSQLLNEGYDLPDIDCVVVLRATKSRPYFAQMIGRGTRIWPGKKDLLILDFLWQTAKHDLCHPCNLIAETPEIAEKMEKIQEREAGEPMDLEMMESMAKRDVIREREEALARELQQQRHKESRLIDPLSYAVMIKDEALCEYEPVFAWEETQATPGQIKLLKQFGINAYKVKTKGYAKHLIDCMINRDKRKLATPGQTRVLAGAGYYITDMSKVKANELINELSSNYWRMKF
jgi:superfamily II DNA or RNA helicase